jgi:hypothetical protein
VIPQQGAIPTRWSSAFEILARRLRRLEEERRLLLKLQSSLVTRGRRTDEPDLDPGGGVDDAHHPSEPGAATGDAKCREAEADS